MRSSKKFTVPKSIEVILGNQDLLVEIFLRLPAKSLIKFKSVSKEWKALITATSFCLLHTRYHRNIPKPQPSFILGSDRRHFLCTLTSKKLIRFRFKFRHVEILQSCNGLMLLKCRKSSTSREKYYICNPTTMGSRRLFLERNTSRLCLVFDPSKSQHYKVVCFRTKGSMVLVETYDSEAHWWSKGVTFPSLPSCTFQNGLYWNEEIYYIRAVTTSYRFVLGDKIHEVRSPPFCQGTKKMYVMVSNGHMHCISLPMRVDKNPLVVLEMDRNDLRWSVKYHALLPESSTSFNPIWADVLGMIRGDKEEDSVLLFRVPTKIMAYRFSDDTMEEIVDMTGKYLDTDRNSHQFIETLVPV